MSRLVVRRSLVTLVTIASVFGGAVAIRAAAGWTAGAAPLNPPPDPAALVAKLQDEQARADAIAAELSQVLDRAAGLKSALQAAQDKAVADADSAKGLATQLALAEAKLATLERQLAAAPRSSGSSASIGASPVAHGDDEHEQDDD